MRADELLQKMIRDKKLRSNFRHVYIYILFCKEVVVLVVPHCVCVCLVGGVQKHVCCLSVGKRLLDFSQRSFNGS